MREQEKILRLENERDIWGSLSYEPVHPFYLETSVDNKMLMKWSIDIMV